MPSCHRSLCSIWPLGKLQVSLQPPLAQLTQEKKRGGWELSLAIFTRVAFFQGFPRPTPTLSAPPVINSVSRGVSLP